MVLNNFWTYIIICLAKSYFCILHNLYVRQKVVMWFSEEQKIILLSCPLCPVCLVPETVLQIKHYITKVVILCPYFLTDQTHHMIVTL